MNLPEILNQIERITSQLAKPTAFYLGKLQDALALDDPGSLNLPGSVLSCMRTLSGVVHFEACLKIGGHTDIVSTRVCNTTEYTKIIEFQNYGLPRRSSPQSYYLPEMTSRKSMIGAGFKISFERIGFLVIRKFYCNDEFPRLECFCIG